MALKKNKNIKKLEANKPQYKELYFITISPPHRRGGSEYHYNNDKYNMTKYLNKISSHWIIYPELSDTFRLHYHGVIRMNSYQKYFKYIKKRIESIGFITMSRIRTAYQHIRTLHYCKKNYYQLNDTCIKMFMYKRVKKTPRVKNPSALDEGIERYFKN